MNLDKVPQQVAASVTGHLNKVRGRKGRRKGGGWQSTIKTTGHFHKTVSWRVIILCCMRNWCVSVSYKHTHRHIDTHIPQSSAQPQAGSNRAQPQAGSNTQTVTH